MDYDYPEACIAVFCKAPIVGQVKTRLMPELSPEQATQVHIILTRRLLTWLSASNLCPVALWCSPDTQHDFFRDCIAQYGVSLHQQCEGDLGIKMEQAIQASLLRSKNVLLIGCDCPSLSEADLRQALDELNGNQDVVIAPAEDGGYVMIGCNAPQPTLFNEVKWGTKTVFSQTINRLNKQAIAYSSLSMHWDVDTADDWQRFCQLK